MLWGLYAKWMTAWETSLTTRDTNRVVRPLEWGFDWLKDFAAVNSEILPVDGMIALNEDIVRRSHDFFAYQVPQDFRIECRHQELFPTNARPETLAQDAEMKREALAGEIEPAQFLRFTSPVRTPYPENDEVNARWYPAAESTSSEANPGKPKQAVIVMPQWNADAISHNALCTLFNRFGISALRLSKPYHDIRRPAELERSDYAVSANIGRTVASCRQAVIDIRSCLDWLETNGYTQFGVLGTSLGSCYAFIAAAHDRRLRVCAFNHASTWFGDVIWTGQSTRHIRAAFEQAALTQSQVRRVFLGISPMSYMDRFAANPRQVLVVHAKYDLTFLPEFSQDVITNFDQCGIKFESKILPCGHYTSGETPFKYIDGWYLGSFIYRSFKRLAEDKIGRYAD
jgi:dienelactone hydrolase